MSSSTQQKIDGLLDRLSQERSPTTMSGHTTTGSLPPSRPSLPLGLNSPVMQRPRRLDFISKKNDNTETEKRLKEIMEISGNLIIDDVLFKTDIKDMEHIEELGNGTCGHVVKMKHIPSGKTIAVKQMRRSGNNDETKRIIMDIEVVLKSDCKYIVKCLGCFITESEVWICMELMDTCFDKLLKRLKQPVPEDVLGKVSVATVEALSYLKDQHNVIHRDVKPSNILLDVKGHVKLCDFGISGRLVDSMAKSRSAGCAAYMAPERIEPDPANPDYDVRADVWSLGITLVELATGVFPYQDCKTDFEVLTKVIGTDPPSLPKDKNFSPQFRDFVACCLTKDKAQRPKYTKLKNHAFIKKYQEAQVNVGDWYVKAIEQSSDKVTPRHSPSIDLVRRQFFTPQQPTSMQPSSQPPLQVSAFNSDRSQSSSPRTPKFLHSSRLDAFQSSIAKKHLPPPPQPPISRPENGRSFSPLLQSYQNHLLQHKRDNSDSGRNRIGFYSPMLPHRKMMSDDSNSGPSSLPESINYSSDRKWSSPSGSPLPLRSQLQTDGNQSHTGSGNTSPMILQRFYHQQKQQQMMKEAEDSLKKPDHCKKRFGSYLKMQLSSDRSGKPSSRHQSPEPSPPPRLNRNQQNYDYHNSPLALRRAFLQETLPTNSPNLARRYIQPTPSPPRRISSDSYTVTSSGSPQQQHVTARFHYTPEPQRRRIFPINDVL